MTRHGGVVEEAYFTFSYSPIRDAEGAPRIIIADDNADLRSYLKQVQRGYGLPLMHAFADDVEIERTAARRMSR